MSIELARELVERVASDDVFRTRLEETPLEQRRALLEAEGFGDVRLKHLSAALPDSIGGELSDEEFSAVAGGGKTGTIIQAATAGAATAAGGAFMSVLLATTLATVL